MHQQASEEYQIQQFLGEYKNIFNEDQDSLYDILRRFTALPVMLDKYINNIFKGMDGVSVSGLQDTISGLVYTDNAEY
ncbi:hypothetical protein BB561_004297 [Smittium simulii]|uniref:Uncharacterized protein n=1 Tax=Smittium simulii TaxID=133385 RepID=A0A2T9YH37_9FUNG|nr:hypothetical protein BB561_004297 [Smittium simulii]